MRQNRKYAVVAALLALAMVGCAVKNYTVHPGSANVFDSQAYDAVLYAHSLIEAAKADLANGQLTADAKPFLNDLIKYYNVANGSYKTYHAAAQSNPAADQSALQSALNDLSKAIAAFATKAPGTASKATAGGGE